MAGEILVKGEPVTKPGFIVDEASEITRKEKLRFVSRGGAKLASVAGPLKLNFKDKVVLDVGSSTGGFTDYALQNGATKVYAVDSGSAQLAYKLRIDPRVVSMERTDIRDVVIARSDATRQSHDLDRHASLAMTEKETTIPQKADMAVIDISFISITKVLDHVATLVNGPIIAMVKPQFEAAKHVTDATKGIIPSQAVRTAVLKEFENSIADRFAIHDAIDSKVSGMKGNVERFYVLKPKS
jgi:23S rRNA (cytidine1920-2'-O)/16S rRNA (cytidine1409-2'-O)-methyltransferase